MNRTTNKSSVRVLGGPGLSPLPDATEPMIFAIPWVEAFLRKHSEMVPDYLCPIAPWPQNDLSESEESFYPRQKSSRAVIFTAVIETPNAAYSFMPQTVTEFGLRGESDWTCRQGGTLLQAPECIVNTGTGCRDSAPSKQM